MNYERGKDEHIMRECLYEEDLIQTAAKHETDVDMDPCTNHFVNVCCIYLYFKLLAGKI